MHNSKSKNQVEFFLAKLPDSVSRRYLMTAMLFDSYTPPKSASTKRWGKELKKKYNFHYDKMDYTRWPIPVITTASNFGTSEFDYPSYDSRDDFCSLLFQVHRS